MSIIITHFYVLPIPHFSIVAVAKYGGRGDGSIVPFVRLLRILFRTENGSLSCVILNAVKDLRTKGLHSSFQQRKDSSTRCRSLRMTREEGSWLVRTNYLAHRTVPGPIEDLYLTKDILSELLSNIIRRFYRALFLKKLIF